MVRDGIQMWNVRELSALSGCPGMRLERFPAGLRAALEVPDPGSYARGCELRFCADSAVVYLMAEENDASADVFWGDYYEKSVPLRAGVVTAVRAERPDAFRPDAGLPRGRYANHVCRIGLSGRGSVRYCAAEGALRPPEAEDAPARTLAVYGSSISHGACAEPHSSCYVQQTARLLGMDAANFAMSGGCMCEPEMAEFIAEEQWDALYLELGVNMRERYTPEQFADRAGHLVDVICRARPEEPKILTTLYPNRIAGPGAERLYGVQRAYDETIRGLAERYASSGVSLVEGVDVLGPLAGLTADLLHPSLAGHTAMAYNLAELLRGRLRL